MVTPDGTGGPRRDECTGRFKIIEQFIADDLRYMFGNPGTVEEGFLDAVSDYFPRFEYILTLQEGVAVGIADGYARVRQKPAIVQLHNSVGLANGISLLYQAKRGHSPLVVIAGEAGLAYDAMDAQNNGNLVDIARPVTKYAYRVLDRRSVLRVLRRAIKMAATPPMGPVFVSLPLDVLDEPNDEPIIPTPWPITAVAPDDDDIERAAAILRAAKQPLFIVGDGVAFSGAQEELARLAELVGAEVWGADSSEVNIPADHPLFGGLLGHMFGESSRPITSAADVVLICGTYILPEVFPALDRVFRDDAQVIHIDLDAYEMGKNFPFTLGLLADPRKTLGKIVDAMEGRLSPEERQAAQDRVRSSTDRIRQRREAALENDRQGRDQVPLLLSRFAEELAPMLQDRDTLIFDEALTNSDALCRWIPPNVPKAYFQTRGGSLGVGLPGAIGLKLAHPEKTVLGFAGDGGAMYTIQALWTAAHPVGKDRRKIGAKFVICNNRSYHILKQNIDNYWHKYGINRHPYPSSFDITDPDIRFDRLAESMGVVGVRVEKPHEIRPAIERMLADDEPFLIDLVIA